MKRTLILAALVGAVAASQAAVVFDSTVTSGVTFSGAGLAATKMGGAILMPQSGMKLTSITFNPVFRTTQAYSSLRISFSIWGGIGSGIGAADPVFTNLVGVYNVDLGSYTSAANTFLSVPVNVSSANIVLPGNVLGLQVSVLGGIGGSAPAVSANLTHAISHTTPFFGTSLFGTNPGGFMRNVNQNSNLAVSFLNNDVRAFGGLVNQSLMTKVEAVPEPGTMAALGLGVAAMLRRRKAAK